MKFKFKRNKRIFLVNRDFQLRYTRVVVIVGLTSTCLTLFLVLYPLVYLDIVRFPTFVPRLFLGGILIASLVNFAAIAFMAIHLTHRIAGPMFSLSRQIRLLQTGKWNVHLKVRSGDELKFLVRNFNEMIDYLLVTSRQQAESLSAIMEKIKLNQSHEAMIALEAMHQEISKRSGLNQDKENTAG